MLARASSDAGSRLRRSKSTSTVQWHPPPIPEALDPEVAQRHALAAATTAYARAREHGTADHSKKRSSELSRAKSSPSRRSLAAQGSHFPPRESSFRSANPQRTTQAPGVQRPPQEPTGKTDKFPSFYPTPGSDRPLSAQPSITFGENLRPSSQPKSHRQSAASSVASQQIRKARSMYYASSVQTGSPIARPPAKYLTTPPMSMTPVPDISPALLQARTTARSPLASPQLPVAIGPSETIDKARDKYLQGFQQRQVKHKPSLFLAPFKKRQDRKRKERPTSAGLLSVSTGNRQASNDARSESLDDFGMPKRHKKGGKRSFSNSLKDKFKKVFRRTSNHATILPIQQIEASRDYFSYQAAPKDRNFDVPSPDDETLLRVRSRTPTIDRAPSPFVGPGSCGSNRSRGSNRSLRSETNVTYPSSRVTSWSDSSVVNTLTQRDIKRLTIIHEAKDSIGSQADRSMSSSSPKRTSLSVPATLAAFQEPMSVESIMEMGNNRIDAKRVFSALMKEIDAPKSMQTPINAPDSSPGAVSDVFESSATKELHISAARELHQGTSRDVRTSISSDQRPSSRKRPDTVHSKTSSIKSFGRALKSTIRTVTPTKARPSPGPDSTASVRGVVKIPRPGTAESESTSSERDDGGANGPWEPINFRTHPESRPATRDSQISTIGTPTAEQIEKRVARSEDRWKTPLDVAHIPIVDRPCNRTLSGADIVSTSTPKAGVESSPKRLPMSDSLTGEAQMTPVRLTPQSQQTRQLFSPLSPSIYSRNTDGMSILPNDSVMSFEGENSDTTREGGSAVIITSHAVKSYVIGTPSPERKTESNRSSRDWKAWLSHEVSELDSNDQNDYSFQNSYTPTIRQCSPTTRHHREFTQIEEDDARTVVARQSTDTVTPRQDSTMDSSPVKKSLEQADTTSVHLPPDLLSTSIHAHAESSTDPIPTRRLSPPLTRSSVLQKQGLSSLSLALSQTSSTSTSSNSTPKSARMNERFPFIKSNRSSSSASAQFHRTSHTPTHHSSGSSSSNSKTTPSPKVYSDFSAPSTSRTSKYEPNTRSKRREEIITDNKGIRKESRKENVTPPTQVRRLEKNRPDTALSLPITMAKPRSMLPLSSVALNRSPSTLSRYTTTAEDMENNSKHARTVSPERFLQRQHAKTKPHPTSPSELNTRSKSAFDLRNTNAPPSVTYQSNIFTPTKVKAAPLRQVIDPTGKQRYQTNITSRMSTNTARLDTDTLHMVLESPWAVSSAPPSPGTSLELTETTRPKLRVKHSSSTLALNKEPSPGLEDRIIDSILICEEKTPSIKRGVEENAFGRGTPGQRMVERFLRERSAPRGSGAGSPVDVVEEAHMSGVLESLKREDTPAFL